MKWMYPLMIVPMLVLVSCSSNSGTGSTSYYYTANEGGSISKIDSSRNQVVDTFPAEGTVHNVQVSPDGKLLGATIIPQTGGHDGEKSKHGTGHSTGTTGKAVFFDTRTGKPVRTVEVGGHPAHIVFTDDGKYALVTNNEDNTVSVIDTSKFEVVRTLPTGSAPHGFRISKDSRFAYIANMGEDTVSVLDLSGSAQPTTIRVGRTPVTTGITSDNRTLVVTLNAENALAVVDVATGKAEKVAVGTGPAQVYVSPDDRFAYVANQGTKQSPSHSVTKVDIGARKAVATIETGEGTHGVVTGSDGKFVYATNMYENTVSVIDVERNKVTSTLKVGATPNGISFQK